LKDDLSKEDLTPYSIQFERILDNSAPAEIAEIDQSVKTRVSSGRAGDEGTPLLIALERQLKTERALILDAIIKDLADCAAGSTLKSGAAEVVARFNIASANNDEVRDLSQYIPLLLSLHDDRKATGAAYCLVVGLNRTGRLAAPADDIPQAQIIQALQQQADWDDQHKQELADNRAATFLAATKSDIGNRLIASRLLAVSSSLSDPLEFFDAMQLAYNLYRQNPTPECLPDVIRIGNFAHEKLAAMPVYTKAFFVSIAEIGTALKDKNDMASLKKITAFLDEQKTSNQANWNRNAGIALQKLR